MTRLRARPLIFLLLLAILWPRAGSAAAPLSEQVTAKTLANGLEMILLPDHKAPVGVVQVWYRVGSRNETPGRTGLSHMLEHMMFKGTERFASGEYSKIIARQGGSENAFTSDDATTYFAKLAADRLDVELEQEADRMRGLVLSAEEFEPERKVVAEERRMRVEDDPISYLFEALNAVVFTTHPYRHPTIGWEGDIESWTLADLKQHYDLYYQPGNAVVIVAGDFEPDEMAQRIEANFGSIPAGPRPPQMMVREEAPRGPKRIEVTRPARLPFVVLMHPTPNLHHGDNAALEVLEVILATGKSSRLHEALVLEDQVALGAGAHYARTAVDDRTFSLSAQAQPGRSAAEVESALLAQIRKIQEAPPGDEELARAKRQIESGFIFSQDSIFYRAMLLGTYEMAGGWEQIDEYLPAVAAVKPEDIQRVARTWLTADRRTTGILHPEKTAPSPTGADKAGAK
ncbi:MAG: pitrilysin family protein [Deltaproteobacteria bacterium]